MTIEQRVHPRFATSLACEITDGKERLLGRTRDLSRGGISLELATPLAVSQVIELALVLVFDPRALSEALRIKAMVVWCTPINAGHQVGAKFVMLSKETQTFIDLFLKLLDGSCVPVDDPADLLMSERPEDALTAAYTRQSPRLPVRLSAEVRVAGKIVTATTRNLSTGGVCLEGFLLLREGDSVMVGLFFVIDEVEDATRPPLELGGRVAWITPDEGGRSLLGVRFERLSAFQLNAVMKFLRVVGEE